MLPVEDPSRDLIVALDDVDLPFGRLRLRARRRRRRPEGPRSRDRAARAQRPPAPALRDRPPADTDRRHRLGARALLARAGAGSRRARRQRGRRDRHLAPRGSGGGDEAEASTGSGGILRRPWQSCSTSSITRTSGSESSGACGDPATWAPDRPAWCCASVSRSCSREWQVSWERWRHRTISRTPTVEGARRSSRATCAPALLASSTCSGLTPSRCSS